MHSPDYDYDLDFGGEGEEGTLEIDHDANFSVKISGKSAAKSIAAFDDPKLGLNEMIVQNIANLDYLTPTPIQCHGMPQMMAQLDMMCCSCTGSGKTASYLLPIINLILSEASKFEGAGNSPRAVILTPTRELAEQICNDAKLFAANLSLNSLAVFGGDSIGAELRHLKRKEIDILMATPGRLIHLLSEFGHVLSLEHTKYLVIDEADEMFNRNFFPQINEIVKGFMRPKEERVTAMFSATFPHQIQYYAKKHLRTDFVFVVVGAIGAAAPNIIQDIIPASQVEKQTKLWEILERQTDKKILIFCNTKDTVDMLVGFLRGRKLKPLYIHSDLFQSERDQAIAEFNEGARRILVATSVASRGLNIKDVALVINYDLPDKIDEYVQRIGRVRTTGIGDLGVAMSFYDEETDSALCDDLLFALKSTNQPVPEFMQETGQACDEYKELFQDEWVTEDFINKLKRIKFANTNHQDTYVDPDYWG